MSDNLIVKPAAGRHAIEVMAFGIELDRMIEEDAIARVSEWYDQDGEFKLLLPIKERLPSLAIKLSNNQLQSLTANSNGLRFVRKNQDDKQIWVADIRQNILSVSCYAYDRWQAARDVAMQIISPLVNTMLEKGYSISVVGLQYQDIFRVETDDFSKASRQLFANETDFLTGNALRQSRPWHVYQGWFGVDDQQRRILNNLNVDAFLDDKKICVFRITGQHKLLSYLDDGITKVELPFSGVRKIWDLLHQVNKASLTQMLSQQIIEMIGMGG